MRVREGWRGEREGWRGEREGWRVRVRGGSRGHQNKTKQLAGR